MTNLLIREWLNGGLIPLNICMITIISITLFRAWRMGGKNWLRLRGIQTACALLWIFIADLIRSIVAWVILHQSQVNPYDDLFTPMTHIATATYMCAAVIAVTATMRLIYTLSPRNWGHKSWVIALVFTVLFLVSAEEWHGLDWIQAWVLTHLR